MQIVYGFVYYFGLLMTALTVSLVLFALAPMRSLLHKFKTRFSNIFENQFIKYGIYLMFAIILLVLVESIFTYSALNSHFKRKSKYNPDEIDLKDLDVILAKNRENYLLQLKQYRQYYLAERNIMLTFAALFIFFAFHRLLHSIVKYSETQHRLGVIDSATSLHAAEKKTN